MDTTHRTRYEKLIVLALLGLFAFTLFGALKNMGVWKVPVSQQRTGTPLMQQQDTPSLSQEIEPGTDVKAKVNADAEKKMETNASAEPKAAALSERGYAASDLRDPLQQLLPAPTPKEALPLARSPQMGVDPSFGLQPDSLAPPNLQLQGLVWGGLEAQAIINDEVYKVGDRVDGTEIVAINRQGVTLDYGGTSTYSLSVPEAISTPGSHR